MEVHPSSWPAEFICPISQSVMADPVIVSSGQTYERRCIEAWMDLGQRWCVKDSIPLDRNVIIPNASLKAAIRNMAKAKGMRILPSPPSLEHAYLLARHLIQELTHPDAWVQESCFDDSEETEDLYGLNGESDGDSGPMPVRVENFEHEEEEEEREDYQGDAQYDDLNDRFRSLRGKQEGDVQYDDKLHGSGGERSTIGESGSSSPAEDVLTDTSANADEHAETSANVDRPKAIHLKSSSSLPPLNSSAETFELGRRNGLRGPSRMQPTDAYQANYVRAASNLEEGFGQFRAANARPRGGFSGPHVNLRSAGEALQDTPHSGHELPPHLLTRPSSYSSSEPSQSSLSPPTTSDPLVERLRSWRDEEQEAAVSELLKLSRVPENRDSLCRTDIIEALLPLFKSRNSIVQVNAVASLVNLSIGKPNNVANKVAIVRAGSVRFLVDVLANGFPEAQEHAAGAAFSLAIADENKHPMGVLNAIPPLVQLLHAGPDRARLDAAMALYHLSLLQANKSKLVKAGAVPILFNLAQLRERPDLASRALIILSNVATIPEGRAALLQLNAIPVLVKLLAVQGGRSASVIAEQAAAMLILLSKNNLRFKSAAQSAGAQELLTALVEKGTVRAREKALALLAVMKESSSGPDEVDANSVLSRQYMRMRVDAGQMNSSAF